MANDMDTEVIQKFRKLAMFILVLGISTYRGSRYITLSEHDNGKPHYWDPRRREPDFYKVKS